MAGLLDIFNTFEGQQALGLLAAGGPQTDPSQTGFGQRMASGLGMAEKWRQRQADAEMEKQKMALQGMQMQNYASEIEQRKAALVQSQQKQEMLSKLFDGGGISPGAFTPSADGMGPTMPPSMQQQSGIGGLDINKIAQLKAQHGIDLMEPFKWANDPLKMEQGATYKDRMSGQERYMPKVGEGVAPNAGGFYGALPGYASSMASIEGAKAGAVESAKARLDPFTMTPQGGGNPILTNRFEAVGQQQRGGIPPHLLAQVMADAQKRGIQPSGIGYNGVEQMAQPGNMAAGFGQRGGVALQSEPEKVAAIDAAKADEARRQGNKDKVTQFKDFRGQLDYAKKLLEAGPTGGNIGAMVDAGLGAFSVSTTSGKLAKQLETTSAWMIQNIPKAPGAQSDAELRDYKTAAGLVGDKTVPVENRLGAITTVNKLIDLWDDRMNNVPKATPMQAPKQAAINDLKMNPKLRDFFDQKYGEGAAARVLGK